MHFKIEAPQITSHFAQLHLVVGRGEQSWKSNVGEQAYDAVAWVSWHPDPSKVNGSFANDLNGARISPYGYSFLEPAPGLP